jgi:hypothetical protein
MFSIAWACGFILTVKNRSRDGMRNLQRRNFFRPHGGIDHANQAWKELTELHRRKHWQRWGWNTNLDETERPLDQQFKQAWSLSGRQGRSGAGARSRTLASLVSRRGTLMVSRNSGNCVCQFASSRARMVKKFRRISVTRLLHIRTAPRGGRSRPL